mgnify:CR=1 FL=1
MRSSFSKPKRNKTSAGTVSKVDETYDLRGLDLRDPDQITPQGEAVKADNCRMYPNEDAGESRVAIRTRKGSTRLSTPVGETLDTQNVAGSTGDTSITVNNWIAEPFTPGTTGALTRVDLEVKSIVAGGGNLVVEIFTDNGGAPGNLLTTSSISAGAITGTYQYLPCYFMDAPTVNSGTQYWKRLSVQPGGTATYSVTKTAAAGGYLTTNPGTVYTAAGYTWRFKSYISTRGAILGFTRRYPQNLANRTLFAMGNNVYSVTDAGVVSTISTAISSAATAVRFVQSNDKTMWVDGNNVPKSWDGTTVTDMTNVTGTPTHIIIHQNRAFFVPANDPTRVNFSDLFDYTSYPSVNFFYVPDPKSPDHIAGWIIFQDNLVIFTHRTKHLILGSDLSSFTRKQAVGTKGAISQEAIVADRNYIYFMADDKQIYRFNGVQDELLSEKVSPILNQIQDPSKVRLHLHNNQLRIYYTTGSDTQAHDMLLLELSEKSSNKNLQWFHDSDRYVCGSLTWDQNKNELIEFSSKAGVVYLGENGESDLGKGINFKYWTNYKIYGSGAAKDRIKRFRPFIRPTDAAYTMQIGKDIDFENDPSMTQYTVDPGGAKWGSFNWNDGTLWGGGTQLVQDKVPMSGRGNATQYRFESSAIDSPVEIVGYISMVKIGRVR